MEKILTRLDRRIYNQVWNGSNDYSFLPEYTAKDFEGNFDIYSNLIIGLSYKYYGPHFIKNLFYNWQGRFQEYRYDTLAWIMLENLVYQKELPKRPLIAKLRLINAEDFFKKNFEYKRRKLYLRDPQSYALLEAYKKECLGQLPSFLDKKEALTYALLKFPIDISSSEIEERFLSIIREYFGFRDGHSKTLLILDRFLHKIKLALPQISILNNFTSLPGIEKVKSPAHSDKRKSSYIFFPNIRERKLEAYIESIYGKSSISEREENYINSKVCTGIHKYFKIRLTNGPDYSDTNNKKILLMAQNQRAYQRQNNVSYFLEHKSQALLIAKKLSRSLDAFFERERLSTYEKSSRGRLNSKKIWKSEVKISKRVFELKEEGPSPNLTVNILLDSSASRVASSEIISLQAYILALALRKSQVKFNIFSYSSYANYEILTKLKNSEDDNLENIFSYFPSGWNRDGLIYRAFKEIFSEKIFEKQLLIIFTDAKPRDMQAMAKQKGELFKKDYEAQAAINDTAKAIYELRKSGFHVACIFSSADEDLPSCKKIFGQNFIRLKSLNDFAQVGISFIERQIKIISK